MEQEWPCKTEMYDGKIIVYEQMQLLDLRCRNSFKSFCEGFKCISISSVFQRFQMVSKVSSVFQVLFKGSEWFSMDPSVSCIREVNMQQSILVAEVVLLLLSIIVLFFVVDEYQTCNESTVLPLRNTNMKPYMLQATSIPTNYKYW